MTVDNTPTIIIGLEGMFHWFKLNEIPNSFTLVIEIIIGVAIALTIFGLQLRTDGQMKKIVNQIKTYTEIRKNTDDSRRNYYIRNIRRNLEYIKDQDRKAVDTMIEFLQFDKYPDRNKWIELETNKNTIKRMCEEIIRWIGKLEDVIGGPEPLERFNEFVSVLDAPFEHLVYDKEWGLDNNMRLRGVDNIIYAHISEIDLFLEKLSEIEKQFQPVTNPIP